MKLTGTMNVVLAGDIHPTVFNAGDECPKEHLNTAKKLGLIKGHKPVGLNTDASIKSKEDELAKLEAELNKRESELNAKLDELNIQLPEKPPTNENEKPPPKK